jgi:hypothetical protein
MHRRVHTISGMPSEAKISDITRFFIVKIEISAFGSWSKNRTRSDFFAREVRTFCGLPGTQISRPACKTRARYAQ